MCGGGISGEKFMERRDGRLLLPAGSAEDTGEDGEIGVSQ